MKKIYFLSIISVFVSIKNPVMALDYYSKATGLLSTFSTWGTITDGTGADPSSGGFNSGNNVYHIVNRTAFNHTSNWNVNTNQLVVIGDGATAVNMTILGGGIIAGAKIDITNTATLTLSKSGGLGGPVTFNMLDINSTVIFNFSGLIVLPLNYGNIVINQNALLGSDIFVYGDFNIAATKILALNSFNLNIDATVSGAGELATSSGSGIYFTGAQTGNIGSLNFNGGSPQIRFIDLTFGNTNAYFTLGTNITIANGYLGQNSGGIDLNGRTLTIASTADANFPPTPTDGFIRGSANSSLILNGTIAVGGGGGSLIMDQTSSSTKSLKVLRLNTPGSALSIGSNLNIIDSLSVLAGDLDLADAVTLKSSNAMKGRVSRIGAMGTISGNLTVETFAKGGLTGWSVVGPSGISGLTVANLDAAGIPMTCVGCTYDPSSAYGFVSVNGYNEPGTGGTEYIDLTSASPIVEGVGYWMYLGDGFTNTSDILWTTFGSIVNTTVNVPVTFNGGSANPGFNLLSNPFASPISWNNVLAASSGVQDAIYIYNADLEATTQFVGGLASPGGTTGAKNEIPMGQGFYVEAISGGGTVTFTENAKISGANTSSNPLLKNAATVGTVFRLKIDGAIGESDETALRFHSDATKNFDSKLDAHKIFYTPGYAGFPGAYSLYTTISTKSLNEDYSINSLPTLQNVDVIIPVLVKVKATAQYTISPLEIANLPGSSCVILKDKLLNINHDLRTGGYVCNVSDTTTMPRFELTICYDNSTTSINTLNASDNSVIIGQNDEGTFVKTSFDKTKHSVISAFNMMGQKIIEEQAIDGANNTIFLNLNNTHDQIIIINVVTENNSTTKKVFVK